MGIRGHGGSASQDCLQLDLTLTGPLLFTCWFRYLALHGAPAGSIQPMWMGSTDGSDAAYIRWSVGSGRLQAIMSLAGGLQSDDQGEYGWHYAAIHWDGNTGGGGTGFWMALVQGNSLWSWDGVTNPPITAPFDGSVAFTPQRYCVGGVNATGWGGSWDGDVSDVRIYTGLAITSFDKFMDHVLQDMRSPVPISWNGSPPHSWVCVPGLPPECNLGTGP